jgi:hypothetical protein
MGVVSSIASTSNLVGSAGVSSLSLLNATKALLKPLPFKGIAPSDTYAKQRGLENVSGGFLFDIPESESLQLKAQITEHYVEDNSAMQDHISIAPISITLTGKIGELVLKKNDAQAYIDSLLTTLSAASFLAPNLSKSAQNYILEYQKLANATERALKQIDTIKKLFADGEQANKQQTAYKELSQMFKSRMLYKVETPWVILDNMAIESITFEQDETTKDQSTIAISLKQIQFAQSKTVKGKISKGRQAMQKAPVADKGVARGKSGLKQIKDYFLAPSGA